MANPRADAIKSLRKQAAEAFELTPDIKRISTGSLAVDLALGGGFPRGRVSEVFGWESSGKTTLCLSACAAAERAGLYWAYLDLERGVDLTWASRLKLSWNDDTKGLFAAPSTMEETFQFIEKLIEVRLDIIVADSIPAMITKKELDGDIDEAGPMAMRARELARVLPKLTKHINQTDTALIFVNQMRAKIETGWLASRRGAQTQTSGGNALRFYSSLRVDMEQLKKAAITRKANDPVTGKERDVGIAALHKAEAFKNKVSGAPVQYGDTTFYIRFDPNNDIYGIDNLQTLLDLAQTAGVIVKKSGGHVTYKGAECNFALQGSDALYQHALTNPGLVGELKQKLTDMGVIR